MDYCTNAKCWQYAEAGTKYCSNHAMNHVEPGKSVALAHAQTVYAIDHKKDIQLKATTTTGDVALAHAQTIYAVDHLGENTNLKHASAPADVSLAHAQTVFAIEHAGENAAQQLHSRRRSQDVTLAHAQTIYAVDHLQEPHLNHVEQPKDGLTAEQIAELQASAVREKAGNLE